MRVDLTGVDLEGVDLVRVDLEGSYLRWPRRVKVIHFTNTSHFTFSHFTLQTSQSEKPDADRIRNGNDAHVPLAQCAYVAQARRIVMASRVTRSKRGGEGMETSQETSRQEGSTDIVASYR